MEGKKRLKQNERHNNVDDVSLLCFNWKHLKKDMQDIRIVVVYLIANISQRKMKKVFFI